MDDHGKTSRRTVMRTGLVLATAGFVGAKTARAQDQKIEQSLVQYQAMPKDGAKCSACVNWVAPNACKIVAGAISPEGWCVAYAPQGG